MGTTTTNETEHLLTGLVHDQQGLGDFWQVYDANRALLTDETATLLANDPEFGPLIAAMSEEDSERQNRESRERLGRAILIGQWDKYPAARAPSQAS